MWFSCLGGGVAAPPLNCLFYPTKSNYDNISLRFNQQYSSNNNNVTKKLISLSLFQVNSPPQTLANNSSTVKNPSHVPFVTVTCSREELHNSSYYIHVTSKKVSAMMKPHTPKIRFILQVRNDGSRNNHFNHWTYSCPLDRQ